MCMIFSEQFRICTHDGMEVLYNYGLSKMESLPFKVFRRKGSEVWISLMVGLSGFCVCRGGLLWKVRVESYFSLAQTKYCTHPIHLYNPCKIPSVGLFLVLQRFYRPPTGRTGQCICTSVVPMVLPGRYQ